MKIIDLNSCKGVQFILFPDNQPHSIVQGVEKGDDVTVVCSITSSLKLVQLLQVSNALKHLFANKKKLIIPYLMAARYDRLMQQGDSFDLELVAELINHCGFEKVVLWDVHSSVALQLINNAVNVTNKIMVEQYKLPDAVLICPDAGAATKVKAYKEWNSNIKEIVYCTKKRELATGKITLEVQNAETCNQRNCVIIDDICDGGATFLAIAGQIKPLHLSLIVTHGIFSKGFEELKKAFQDIITSNSYEALSNSSFVKQVNLDYESF
jgi:ribose-phosphate pyrophosphokinase